MIDVGRLKDIIHAGCDDCAMDDDWRAEAIAWIDGAAAAMPRERVAREPIGSTGYDWTPPAAPVEPAPEMGEFVSTMTPEEAVAVASELRSMIAAPVEPAPGCDVASVLACRCERLEEASRPLLDQFDRYLKSDLSHYAAHNMLVQYELWDTLRRALASDGEEKG